MHRPQKRRVPIGVSKKRRRCLSKISSWVQDMEKLAEPQQHSIAEFNTSIKVHSASISSQRQPEPVGDCNRQEQNEFTSFLQDEFSKINAADMVKFPSGSTSLEETGSNEGSSSSDVEDTCNFQSIFSSDQPSKNSVNKLLTLYKWQNILAIVAVTGSVKFTVEQYNILRNSINWLLDRNESNEQKLPSYSTVQKKLLPTIAKNNYVTSKKVLVKSKRNMSDLNGPDNNYDESIPVSYISPLTWAKRDLLSPETWKLFKQSIKDATNKSLFPCKDIDRSPITRNRSSFLGSVLSRCNIASREQISQRNTNFVVPCFTDHEVEIELTSVPDIPECISEDFINSLNIRQCNDSSRVEIKGVAKHYFIIEKPICVGEVVQECQESSREGISDKIFVSTRKAIENLSEDQNTCWSAGDICCILSLSENESCIAAFVFCHNLMEQSKAPMNMVWLPRKVVANDCAVLDVHNMKYQEAIDFKNVTSRADSTRSLSSSYNYCDAPPYGFLDDGSPYFIYRILLYADGFSESMSQNGSYTGCYFLPLNLPLEFRRSRSAVRLVALAPPGVSSNQIFKLVFDDLVEGATTGYDCFTADGEKVKLFLDVVGTVADYPAVTELLDVLGHTARSPCHLCSFRRRKKDNATDSYYAISTGINSSHLSYMRCLHRTKALRSAQLHENQYRDLGMADLKNYDIEQLALFALQRRLSERASQVPVKRNDSGLIVSKTLFDPYRSTFIGPDHLLHGITISILSIGFKLLPSVSARRAAEKWILNGLSSNGLQKQRKILNDKKGILHSMTISQSFSVLLIADAVFNEMRLYDSNLTDSYQQFCKLMTDFRRLVGKTYWMPSKDLEGDPYIKNIWDDGGSGYISSLKRDASEFTEACHIFISNFPGVGYILDKPNLHRIVELYNHSIPAFGHVSHFAELVFENAHQPLKRAIKRSNHNNPHLQATNHYLADEWRDRLQCAIGASQELEVLRKFILQGNEGNCISDDQNSELDTTSNLLKSIYAVPGLTSGVDRSCARWIAFGVLDLLTSEFDIEKVISETEIIQQTGATFCKKYKYAKFCKNQKDAQSYGHYKIRSGSVIYFVKQVENSESWEQYNTRINIDNVGRSERKFYVVIGVVGCFFDIDRNEKEVFAIVRQCQVQKKRLWIDTKKRPTLLKLDTNIRKAAVMHCCSIYKCFEDGRNRGCNVDPLSGDKFRYFTKRDGYPPRQA